MNAQVIMVSCPDAEKADEIATVLVERRLAACVQIIPGMTSVYHWQGKIEKEAEALLLIKSSDELLQELKDALVTLHPYDTPEFISFKPSYVVEKYAKWLADELKRG